MLHLKVFFGVLCFLRFLNAFDILSSSTSSWPNASSDLLRKGCRRCIDPWRLQFLALESNPKVCRSLHVDFSSPRRLGQKA